MRKPTVKCALLAAMVAKHRWGSPIDEERLLAVSAIEKYRYLEAREVFSELRSEPFVRNAGKRGIELDNSAFGLLADFLYRECGWEPHQIRSRLKHYRGWDQHEWA
jgi:hypothetical protein